MTERSEGVDVALDPLVGAAVREAAARASVRQSQVPGALRAAEQMMSGGNLTAEEFHSERRLYLEYSKVEAMGDRE